MVIKLRPAGPWRIGPDTGARNKVDAIYHSDSLYGAVCSAMARMGRLEEWLDATARSASSEVCFSSCFPFLDEIGFVPPPRTVWPPAQAGLTAARVRWKSARFVPLGIVQAILAGQRLDDGQWAIDGPSECLVPIGRLGPFRAAVRWSAAVDRLTGATERHSTACLEFRPGSGMWLIVAFRDDAARERWATPVQAALRWLADSGFGGERSRGWGRAEAPEFIEGSLPEMILGAAPAAAPEPAAPVEGSEEAAPAPTTPAPANDSSRAHWLLSLFTPAADDAVDWARGNYTMLTRGGRVETSGELKKQAPMVAEGSVVYAASAPRGSAADVAPEGSAHPVYRAGFALAIALPEVPA